MMLNYFDFVKALSMHEEPPTLYSIMQSIVNYGKEDKTKIKDLWEEARIKIFNFEYPLSPLFNKANFEKMFLNHYMFRRINFDTFTSFQIHLDVKLNEIMPKYNKMIEGFSSLDFLGTVEHHTKETSLENIASTSDTARTGIKYSNTPQGQLEKVEDGEYVTEYTLNEGTNSGSSQANANSNENITITRGDNLEEYKKFMEIANNIYTMIFNECDSLFYGIVD